MSEYDLEQVQKWIDEHWTQPEKSCQICGTKDWVFFPNVWELRDFRGGTLTVGGPVLPVVAMMCNHCGYTHFFNAIAVRAVVRPASQEGK